MIAVRERDKNKKPCRWAGLWKFLDEPSALPEIFRGNNNSSDGEGDS
jgi:hypothetical protein